jgi:signal transduction histidine kinase/CheY-like chemotaxis protein/CHASE3 domain sensor protein
MATLLAVLVIAALVYRSFDASTDAANAVSHTDEVQDHLFLLLSAVKDAETGQRGFLLNGSERYLEPYHFALDSIAVEQGRLRQLTAGDAAQQRGLDLIASTISSLLAEIAQTIALKRTGDDAGALAILRTDRGTAAMTRLRDTIDAMLGAGQGQLEQLTNEWEARLRGSSYVIFGGASVLLCMAVLIVLLASRDFRSVRAEGWARRVHLALTAQLQGDFRLESIGEKVLRVLVDHLHARVGAIYVAEPGGELRRVAGHALACSGKSRVVVRLGDGLTGQAAKDNRTVHVRDLPDRYLDVSSTVGKAKPRELVIVPASADGVVQAVTELGFLHRLDPVELAALDRMSESIATAIRTARDRSRLEELLREVRHQAEALQIQQEDLRVANEELEQQARARQVLQTQLESQQSKLEKINSQLEEQAQTFERQRDELAATGTELQRSNAVKTQFLANMSHELRTPLNSSLILAKLLADNREGNLSPEQIRFAQTIHAAGNDLLTLINDILDLSKIEAGMLDVRPEPISIARLVDEVTRTVQPVAAQKRLALEVHVDESAPEPFETDPARLSQILKNLLSNALKFTERGGVSLEVGAADQGVRFAVRDTGIGIAADQHELIFEAFRQADGASNRKFGGTGLGLSISRDLARRLGGDLRVASAPGQGSTFTLTLPSRFAVQPLPLVFPPAPIARRTSMNKRVATVNAPPFPDDRDRVNATARSLLIVEDDPAFARVVYDLAHELGFLGLVATTADAGVALARQYCPRAIILDIELPDRPGLAVLDSLKRDPSTRHVPVHVVSATNYARTALEMGAAGHGLKPVDRECLVHAIRRLEAKFTQTLHRVLIVQDDPLLREGTARLLGTDDVEIVAVGTTTGALIQLEATTFDCMVLDLALPGRSGLALLEEMSRGEPYRFPPIIAYTGRSASHDELGELGRFSQSLIIKGARSPERLLDEVTLFLHQVESKLPLERQRMLRDARDREAVFEGRSILVVEDDVRNVFALTSVLEPKGASVEIARNGREALDYLRANSEVDLVLMDIMMPEMDGLEATRELRKDPRFAKLPILALTAKAMIDDREKCLAAGANDYIAKPLDVGKLLSLARVWIRK